MLELIQTHLGKEGHQTVGAGSAEEAVSLLDQKGPPDLAVLDVDLPGMDGIELLKALRQREGLENLPAIFLSGRVGEADVTAGRSLGAAYLTKPFVASALTDAVARALAGVEGRSARSDPPR
jgi:CheY-like chemotaxis protein